MLACAALIVVRAAAAPKSLAIFLSMRFLLLLAVHAPITICCPDRVFSRFTKDCIAMDQRYRARLVAKKTISVMQRSIADEMREEHRRRVLGE